MSRNRHPQPGFTLIELLLVVLILGVLAAVGSQSLITIARRERANRVTSELASWLEQTNREATQFNAQSAGTSCSITISNGTMVTGAVMATTAPIECSSQSSLRVPDLYGSTNISITANPTSFVFTPRGTLASSTGSALPNNEVQIIISVDNQPPLRCIRLLGLIGVLELGRNNNVADGNCNVWGRV